MSQKPQYYAVRKANPSECVSHLDMQYNSHCFQRQIQQIREQQQQQPFQTQQLTQMRQLSKQIEATQQTQKQSLQQTQDTLQTRQQQPLQQMQKISKTQQQQQLQQTQNQTQTQEEEQQQLQPSQELTRAQRSFLEASSMTCEKPEYFAIPKQQQRQQQQQQQQQRQQQRQQQQQHIQPCSIYKAGAKERQAMESNSMSSHNNNKFVDHMILPEYSDRHIVVKNLPVYYTPEMFLVLASKSGDVVKLKMAFDSDGVSKGFGFIEYASARDAMAAIRSISGYLPNGSNRPLIATFAVSQSFGGNNIDDTNIYISGLPLDFDRSELDELFGQFGIIVESCVHRDNQGKPFATAFVRYADPSHASDAIASMNGKFLALQGQQEPASYRLNVRMGKVIISQSQRQKVLTKIREVRQLTGLDPPSNNLSRPYLNTNYRNQNHYYEQQMEMKQQQQAQNKQVQTKHHIYYHQPQQTQQTQQTQHGSYSPMVNQIHAIYSSYPVPSTSYTKQEISSSSNDQNNAQFQRDIQHNIVQDPSFHFGNSFSTTQYEGEPGFNN